MTYLNGNFCPAGFLKYNHWGKYIYYLFWHMLLIYNDIIEVLLHINHIGKMFHVILRCQILHKPVIGNTTHMFQRYIASFHQIQSIAHISRSWHAFLRLIFICVCLKIYIANEECNFLRVPCKTLCAKKVPERSCQLANNGHYDNFTVVWMKLTK